MVGLFLKVEILDGVLYVLLVVVWNVCQNFCCSGVIFVFLFNGVYIYDSVGMNKDEYCVLLYDLQIELVVMQCYFIVVNYCFVIVLEGCDVVGKDGLIKCIIEYFSLCDICVVVFGKFSECDCGSWYFQCYVLYLFSVGECVIFNCFWYNCVGVELVMGFCMCEEWDGFLDQVVFFECMQVEVGSVLLKYYLDVLCEEQVVWLEVC